MFENSNIKRKIIDKAAHYKGDSLFKGFVESFYSYIPIDDKKFYDVEEFTQISTFVYSEVSKKQPKKHHIKIEELEASSDAEGVSVIIAIINDDMPFIVDSLTEFFNKRKYKVKHRINALLCVNRDAKGKVQSIKESDENNPPNESAIYIKVSLLKEEGYIEDLESKLNKILSYTRVTSADWQPTLKKLDEANSWFLESESNNEDKEFLRWLRSENFTFIGYREYKFSTSGKGVEAVRNSSLGIVKMETSDFHSAIASDVFGANNFLVGDEKVTIGKTREISPVHRRTNLDYICVVKRGKNNKPIKARVFFGLFATRLDYQSVNQIPIIRYKVDAVVRKAGFHETSFNQKELFSIIETLPRDELFQLSEDELFLMTMMIISSLNNPRVLFFARENRCKFFMNLLVFFPKSRVTSDIVERVQSIISENIKGRFVHSTLRFSIMGLAYIHIAMRVSDNRKMRADMHKIEQKLDDVTKRWDENLDVFIERKFGIEHTNNLLRMYRKAFPANYKLKFSVEDAVDDMEYVNQALMDAKPLFNLCKKRNANPKNFSLKTYNLESKVDLHKVMPIIENMGFCTIEENVFRVNTAISLQPVVIQDFSLMVSANYDLNEIRDNIQNVIEAVFQGKIRNNLINNLALKVGLTWREIFLLDAYCRYMLQIKFVYSQAFIKSTLVKNGNITKLIIDYFYSRLHPENYDKESSAQIEKKIKSALFRVSNSSEDKVLQKFLELIKRTLRTNYFKQDNEGGFRDYISFKFDSKNISELPLPKAYAEIFVYSVKMEGVHLRGGKISRGGLRWSDRVEDYRTEVLGLMKAQMTKNSIIVPDGAKGGFLVKNAEDFKTREEFMNAGVECYKTFLRGMLDITDNIVLGKIVKPSQVQCFDGDDPYLVVAADKGTATFSDTANAVSQEYNFWLGDAFASGGEYGYDHKKMGITARGAWVSVTEHFTKLGIDIQKEEFTAVGIGDMSGDVFGNGMLLSKCIKLVAAFNHLHIFVDPTPDASKSYKERKRLFDLPRSNWSDYKKELISKGGGVFERSAKSIKISNEMKNLFGIKQDSLDPDCLIRSILTAKVDLLWNGGIGTYVKAEREINDEIGNKSNDSVRVNGSSLQCKVVGEGGNLGFTQLGRIEYAFKGGLVNADFIDNSAGVNCSDHEVNIKIALDAAVVDKKITKNNRDKVLSSMQDEVASLVLHHDLSQNQSISISINNSVTHFEFYTKLIGILEDKVDLDSELEYLPMKNEISRRHQDRLGFSRPEISVLTAYSKRSVYESLIDSSLPQNTYYEKFLLAYFPTKMRDKFKDYIINHQLKKEIISAIVSNNIIDHVGPYFFHSAQEYTGLNGCDIARAYSVVWEVFEIEKLWQEIEKVSQYSIKIELFCEVRMFLQRAIFWFLRNKPQPLNVSDVIEKFKTGVAKLFDKAEGLFVGSTKNNYEDRNHYFSCQKVSKSIASKVSCLSPMHSAMDIVEVANKTDLSFIDVGKIYFDLGEKLHYNWLHTKSDQLSQDGYWERMLIKALKDDIYDQQREVTLKVAKISAPNIKAKISKWLQRNNREVLVFSEFIKSIQCLEDIDSAKLIVATKQSSILIN
ncbi:MAG: NAD-glutamate dehydrogenase [Alphaproteobacteria bacterium]|nr:NAD-glutamate dehydrogenase [Alphaproteobacteria bacterium]